MNWKSFIVLFFCAFFSCKFYILADKLSEEAILDAVPTLYQMKLKPKGKPVFPPELYEFIVKLKEKFYGVKCGKMVKVLLWKNDKGRVDLE